jgi:hypothetical protein
MESRELPKRPFRMLRASKDTTQNEAQDLLNQGYRIESMTMAHDAGHDIVVISLYLTLDPNAAQSADPKSE